MDLKEKIERVRCELGEAIERKDAPDRILHLSRKLDLLIERYLEYSGKK
ncbi:Spo0E family sporulation regulatory protein-aspartic acid phosphatase [Lacrimispora sp. NSJ-141]|uniref:Spo0E family sporulation regulatory protein-aspartic acid phosphatase n=1 Tax=Lientehia hominis TaxID=2897778 RepID=A0AAP2RFZ3_9FIRM|nr:Spo0E family sporulation regulatory protein-aspartic acid phosphatase [Lientehia hominis]MCD2491287.1 Spo0E family sporulation regulatory protein-aspartic acid phosphatase [Lientehia hominis]